MLNQRTLIDLNLQKTFALPAAAATATSASLDLLTITAGRVRNVELALSTSAALPNLANATTITFTVLESSDNATFAAAADLPAYVLTGANGVGSAALSVQVKLPINLKRYIQLQAVAASGSGNNTAVNAIIGLVF